METIKIDVKPHRYYNFRHDLDIDWKWIYYEEAEALKNYKKLDKKYYTYELDFFDHSAISFSLVIDRQNIGYYEFDRSRNVGLIAIPRSIAKNGFEAQQIARDYLEDYNMEINGRDEDGE